MLALKNNKHVIAICSYIIVEDHKGSAAFAQNRHSDTAVYTVTRKCFHQPKVKNGNTAQKTPHSRKSPTSRYSNCIVANMFQCGYSTHTVEVMRRHVLTHVKDKPYKCSLCKQSYIQRSQLLRHLETHTGFVCSYCEKRFPNKAT